MRIADIFYSIQGEGELTGIPSVFIRTSGCNLRCRWCDTPYASWNPEGDDWTLAEIVAEVKEYPEASHVVLTGGEPMIAKGIHDLAKELKHLEYHITIETAGTVSPNHKASGIPILCDLVSISPKLMNSVPDPEQFGKLWVERHKHRSGSWDAIHEWVANYAFQLKFVLSTEQDALLFKARVRLDEWLKAIPSSKILLMPEGITPEEIKGRQEWLIAFCKEFGYRYCNRLHIDLFGNTRAT